jgi:hypothetical protein
MNIEIAVSCTYFQKRLCWMASSLLQQDGNAPKLTFSVAYPKNNGNPTTEAVCAFFKGKGLDVKELVYPDERAIQFRGLVRNAQLAAPTADWVLFSDSDMVYSRGFFAALKERLEGDLANETRCISASRISLDKDYSKQFFNVDDRAVYPVLVEDPSAIVSKWPVFQISRNCGAGYFQLINVESVRRLHGGLYVDPSNCADKAEFDDIHKTRSDSQFRSRVGGLKRIELPPQWHLNHERDNEVGHHLTIQR